LSCEAAGSGHINYQWRRVNGSKRTTGVNTQNLTISPVREEDEDEYYCVTTNGGMGGMRYNDTSQKVHVTVFGKFVQFVITFMKPCLPNGIGSCLNI